MSRIDIKPRIVEDLEKYELYRDKKKTTYTVGSIKKDRFIMASEKMLMILLVSISFSMENILLTILLRFIRTIIKK